MRYDFSCFVSPCTVYTSCETPSPLFIELKKVDYRVCLEYHTEKIIPNSSEMKRKKIVLSERQRVCDFSFISLEFVNFRSLDIRVNTVFYFTY